MSDSKKFDSNWAVGIALIIVGVLFLLDSLHILDISFTNWWAIFILIPGLKMAVDGWRFYRQSGATSAKHSGFWGLVLIVVALTFFFNISWSYILPAVLICGGVYLLFFQRK